MPESEIDILESFDVKEPEDAVLARLQRYSTQAIDHEVWRDFREKGSRDHLFFEGEHWSTEEKASLKDRKQPETVFNEIKPIIERAKGQIDDLYQTTKFIGRNAPDEAEAHSLSDILKWVDQQNGQEFEEGDAVTDMLVSGFGCIEITTEEDELGQTIIREKYVDALNYIYPDPYSRKYDWNEDARFIARASWMDIEDAIAMWPESQTELEAIVDRNDVFEFAGQPLGVSNDLVSMFVDRERRRVRPAEVWYKRKARRFNILDDEGRTIPLGIPLDRKDAKAIIASIHSSELSLKESLVDEMWVGVFAVNVLIHHDRSPHQHGLYPFVPLWAWRKKNGGPYGLVRNLVSINEAINKRESKALHLLSNNQVIFETGSVDDPNKLAAEMASPDGVIEVNEGALSGNRFKFRDNTEMGSAQLNMHQNAVGAMQRIATATDRDRGLSPEIRSGIGVARQQRGASMALIPLIKNIRRSRRMKAKLKLEYIKQYFTEELVFQITDDPNAARTVKVPSSHLDSLRTKQFDVIIVDETDFETSRTEEQSKLANMLPQLIPLGPAWVEVGIQLSNLRDKEGLIKLVRQINQPAPPDPKISLSIDYSNLDPEERAIMWQKMGSPELAQHIMQNRPDSALMKGIKADIAKTQIKEGTRAQMERGKHDAQAAKTAEEGKQQARELDQQVLMQAIQQTAPEEGGPPSE